MIDDKDEADYQTEGMLFAIVVAGMIVIAASFAVFGVAIWLMGG